MEMQRKKIKIITLGGTIGMAEDDEGKARPQLSGQTITKGVKELSSYGKVTVEELYNIPSGHLTIDMMFHTARCIEGHLTDDIDGFVILQGTDTLEETAYFLDLVLGTEKPVVVTGAMRNHSEPGYDGRINILQACRTAADDRSKNRGVLVVFNETIYSAQDVVKAHASNLAAFTSTGAGPVGIIDKNEIYYYRKEKSTAFYPVKESNADVALLKMAVGLPSHVMDYLVEKPVDGIVIEGFGRGQVPPEWTGPIKKAIAHDIPVVLASRCMSGMVSDVYGYPASASELKDMGVVFAGDLSGQKARLKLIVLLGMTSNLKKIKKDFEEEFYSEMPL